MTADATVAPEAGESSTVATSGSAVKLRGVVADLDIPSSDAEALTVTRSNDRLIGAAWDERLTLLAEHPELVDPAVAAAIGEHDPVLYLFEERASEAGLAQAKSEPPVAISLESLTSEPLTALPDAATDALSHPERHGARWLLQIALSVVEDVATDDNPFDSPEPRDSHLSALAALQGAARADLDTAMRLAHTDWDQVWDQLPDLYARIGGLRVGAAVLREHAYIFYAATELVEYAAELADILHTTQRRGHAAAVTEHQIVLQARPPGRRNSTIDWLTHAHDTLAGLLTGAQNPAVTGLSRPRWSTARRGPNWCRRQLGAVAAVLAGQVELADMTLTVALAREATDLTEERDPVRPMYESNLGFRVCAPASIHRRPQSARRRQQSAAADAPDNRIGDAVHAGAPCADELPRAVAVLHDAKGRVAPVDPDHAMYVMNWGNAIAEAASAGVFGIDSVVAALDEAEAVVDTVPSGPPDLPGHLWNLSSVISMRSGSAWPAGALTAARFHEAVCYARQGTDLTQAGHPRHDVNVSNLAVVIDQVRHGSASSAEMTTVLELARSAADGLTPDHPDRVGCVVNLGVMLEQACDNGTFSAAEAAAVMVEGVDEFWLWARPDGLVTVAARIVLDGAGPRQAIRAPQRR